MYQESQIYIDDKETLYGIPCGLSKEEWLGYTSINKIVVLQHPYSDADMARFLHEIMDLCNTERGVGLKDPSPIAVHLKKKSWTAATKKLWYVYFCCDENNYYFRSSQKQPKGAYSVSEEKYIAGASPTDEELINAFIEAKNNSTL